MARANEASASAIRSRLQSRGSCSDGGTTSASEPILEDVVAVRIRPDIRFAVVGSESYFANHALPKTPRDLVAHGCINLRLPTYARIWAWEFERNGRELKVRVEGQLTFNSIYQVRDGAGDGYGPAYLPEDLARPHLAKGKLIWVLQEWSPPWPGLHLYCPSRRQSSPAFALIVDALRYRGGYAVACSAAEVRRGGSCSASACAVLARGRTVKVANAASTLVSAFEGYFVLLPGPASDRGAAIGT